MDLFDAQGEDALTRRAPLAERLRPRNLKEVIGQNHLTGPGGPLRTAVEKGRLGAIVLWGPPGTGRRRSPEPWPRRWRASSSP